MRKMGKMSDLFKKEKEKKLSDAARSYILSGDDVFESTQILQALKPARDLIDMHIVGLKMILDRFCDDGGTIGREDIEDGFQAVFAFNLTTMRLRFDEDGNAKGMSFEDKSPEGIDLNSLSRVYDAARACTELPRRNFAAEELDRIVAYVENDNALKGLQKMKDILGNDVNIVYQAATQEPETIETAPDYSEIMKVRGTHDR